MEETSLPNPDASEDPTSARSSKSPTAKASGKSPKRTKVNTARNKSPQKASRNKVAKKALPTKTKAKLPRPYPRVTLEEALKLGINIKEINGDNPWETIQAASSLGLTTNSNKFFYIAAASRDFGITLGSRDSPRIELTEEGREILYAPDADIEHSKKIEAFLRIDIFKRVLEYYKGSSLPEMKYLANTLQKEFGLIPDYHEEFSRLFRQNCQELGIDSGIEPTIAGHGPASGPNVRTPSVVKIAEPKGRASLKAFVIMPFTERSSERPKGFFIEVLRSLITPAAVEAGFSVETANRQGSDVIQSTIINDLLDADLVIADLTDHNPNVLFELGLRMAEGKPVALIKASGTGRIFDVDNMLRVYEYNGNLWTSTIEKDQPAIKDHISGA